MGSKLLFYANFKGNKNSYIESVLDVDDCLDQESIDADLVKWVKGNIIVQYVLISVDAANNHTFEYNAIMNGKKHKGVYSVFCEEGEKKAEKDFNQVIIDYLIRDIVEYGKDELFDEEQEN